MSFYTFLRSHSPLTHRGVQKRINEIYQEQKAALEKLTQKNVQQEEELQNVYNELKNMQQTMNEIKKQNEANLIILESTCRNSAEGTWAAIFNQTIHKENKNWLKDVSFSPGRWAVGYQYLYVLYRVLNEVHPQNILELGLGQSTKMIAQYAIAFPNIIHQVVEHDPQWISFFAQNYKLPRNTKLVRLDREFSPYKEADKVRVFKGFKKHFQGQKFDFISIDAPLGGDMKQYARIDVLQMLPEILAENWVIMIDDCNRSGEQHTVKEMEEKLKISGIAYAKGKYSGAKDCVVLAAEKMKFVCSM